MPSLAQLGGQIGFTQPQSALRRNIFIPKYYDPAIPERLDALRADHTFTTLRDLVDRGEVELESGDDIGKMTYGGSIPFVRTSDIGDWEITSLPKQGVETATLEAYKERQNVRAGDILLVKDGLYLIGKCALVSSSDLPMLYQSHLLRIRVTRTSTLSPELLLLMLSAPVVEIQVRSKQFTAGIIDKIEDRVMELELPIPEKPRVAARLASRARVILEQRRELRELLRQIPMWVQGMINDLADETWSREQIAAVHRESSDRLGFVRPFSDVTTGILLAKYYEPGIESVLSQMRDDFDLVTIGELVEGGAVTVTTGTEVGKMAYSTGDVPFVRTSDLASWELNENAKQKVSRKTYLMNRDAAGIEADDILLVRDGTFLIGTSAIVTSEETEMLFAGGIYNLRCNSAKLDPYLLLALLNMPIVKRQIRAKQFTRDIIDTLGKRLFELVLPIPRSAARQKEIAVVTKSAVGKRVELRQEMQTLIAAFEEG